MGGCGSELEAVRGEVGVGDSFREEFGEERHPEGMSAGAAHLSLFASGG